jgi:hypothetical protein
MEEFKEPLFSTERWGFLFQFALSTIRYFKKESDPLLLSHPSSPGDNPMTTEKVKRKLTAILSADVKGYSRLMGEDEEWTLRTLNTYKGLIRHLVGEHRGAVRIPRRFVQPGLPSGAVL